jgi:hypothetical protein
MDIDPDVYAVNFDCWFHLPDKGLSVCVPGKCGGTSFYRSVFGIPDDVPTSHVRYMAVNVTKMNGCGPWPVYTMRKMGGRKIQAVRDPVTRFRSLWRYMYRGQISPAQLLAKVTAYPHGDPLWFPQYLYQVPGSELVDYRKLPAILGYDMHANQTSGDESMPEDAIREHFAQDVALWNSVAS